jgi:hypothetical protein
MPVCIVFMLVLLVLLVFFCFSMISHNNFRFVMPDLIRNYNEQKHEGNLDSPTFQFFLLCHIIIIIISIQYQQHPPNKMMLDVVFVVLYGFVFRAFPTNMYSSENQSILMTLSPAIKIKTKKPKWSLHLRIVFCSVGVLLFFFFSCCSLVHVYDPCIM